jgi:hypothetical protein
MKKKKNPHLLFLKKTKQPIEIGAAGLWKTGHKSGPGAFMLQAGLIDSISDRETIEEWANKTRAGENPEGWEPPTSDELDHVLTKEALVFRHGAVLREARVLRNGQFSLQLNLATLEDDISDRRMEWLNAFLREASAYWPLVRFGLDADNKTAVAEVNLTGAPHCVLEALLQPALDSFRWIVAGLVETAEFITSPESESGVIESLIPVGPLVRTV